MKRESRPRVVFVAIVLVLLLGVVYVLSLHNSHRADTIEVGTILGLTGNEAMYGKLMLGGFEFAVEQINIHGGITQNKLRLITEDSQFDPIKAVAAYRRLPGPEAVKVIVGITGSKNALAVCEAARNDNVIIIDPLGSAPKLTSACGGKNYFRIMPSDALAGKYNVDWALQGGMKSPAIVYEEDDWGTSYRDALLGYLNTKGFRQVFNVSVVSGSRDFRVPIQKLKDAHPDVVFLLLYAKDGAGFMRQLREAGMEAIIYGSDNISTSEFTAAGAAAIEGVRVALPTPATGPAYDAFVDRYKAAYGKAPDSNVMKSYDAMELTAQALRAVGNHPDQIRRYLLSPTFVFYGVSGLVKFDAHGDILGQQYTRWVYHSGKLVPVP